MLWFLLAFDGKLLRPLGNSAKVNITEDEHAVLFTGYNKDEIARLGVDARTCARVRMDLEHDRAEIF